VVGGCAGPLEQRRDALTCHAEHRRHPVDAHVLGLPPTAASVPLARRLVRDVLRIWNAPQDREDAELLVTELVANVVDHVGGDVLTLEVVLGGAWLRIAVVDGSAIQPIVREMSLEQERGRGMRLVAHIADRWGAEDHDGGKRVWFELSPPGGGRPLVCPPVRAGTVGETATDR
jgi:anti-sigma regulatory factor (Ser/Thr protein kinase)